MSVARRMRRLNDRAVEKASKENEAKVSALVKYRLAVCLALESKISTTEVVFIGKEEFLYIYENKVEGKAQLMVGLSHYMTLVQIDLKLLEYGTKVADSYLDREDVPVIEVPGEILKKALAGMQKKDMFLKDPTPYNAQ